LLFVEFDNTQYSTLQQLDESNKNAYNSFDFTFDFQLSFKIKV